MSEKHVYIVHSCEETIALGKQLGAALSPGDVVGLIGSLGAGKTYFTKGVALGLGIDPVCIICSPTFIIVNVYKGKTPLYHFDLYRIGSLDELELMGYRDYFDGYGVSVIEWIDRFPHLLNNIDITVTFTVCHEEYRRVAITFPAAKKEQFKMLG